MSGSRYITLGRCLFLLVSSVTLGEVIAYLLSRAGVPKTVNLLGWGMEWAAWLGAAIFMAAFRAFSESAENHGAA